MTEIDGLKLAIRYSIVPCQLGFCGPVEDKKIKLLLAFLAGQEKDTKEIKTILEEFSGTQVFYKAIAKKNDIW